MLEKTKVKILYKVQKFDFGEISSFCKKHRHPCNGNFSLRVTCKNAPDPIAPYLF